MKRPLAGLSALWRRVLRTSRRTPNCLRLCASLPLGERRFVAVVEFEKERFLVGGTPASLVLLSRLADSSGRGKEGTNRDRDTDIKEDTPGSAAEKPEQDRWREKC